jgi:hypothetical protein
MRGQELNRRAAAGGLGRPREECPLFAAEFLQSFLQEFGSLFV